MSGQASTTREDISAFCRSYIEELLGQRGMKSQDLTNEAHLIRRGFLDSMDVLDLIASIEEQYGVEFDFGDKDPDEIMSIDGLTSYCLDQLKQG